MAKYTNITTATSTTLTLKSAGKGGVSRVQISNNSSSEATISLFLDNGTNQHYFVKNVVIPTGVALLLNDSIPFDSLVYELKITNSGTSPDLTLVIS
jgi:hypothetical protein